MAYVYISCNERTYPDQVMRRSDGLDLLKSCAGSLAAPPRTPPWPWLASTHSCFHHLYFLLFFILALFRFLFLLFVTSLLLRFIPICMSMNFKPHPRLCVFLQNHHEHYHHYHHHPSSSSFFFCYSCCCLFIFLHFSFYFDLFFSP